MRESAFTTSLTATLPVSSIEILTIVPVSTYCCKLGSIAGFTRYLNRLIATAGSLLTHSPRAGGAAMGLSGAVGVAGTSVAGVEEGAAEETEDEEAPRGKGAGDFEAVTG